VVAVRSKRLILTEWQMILSELIAVRPLQCCQARRESHVRRCYWW